MDAITPNELLWPSRSFINLPRYVWYFVLILNHYCLRIDLVQIFCQLLLPILFIEMCRHTHKIGLSTCVIYVIWVRECHFLRITQANQRANETVISNPQK